MSDELRDRRVATLADPQLRDYKVVGGLDTFANRSFWPNFFSKLVARLQWDPSAIDLTPDAREWPRLPAERRRRLRTLLVGFRVGDDLVSEHIAPFADAARRAAARAEAPPAMLEFFEEQLPAMAAEIAAGRKGLSEGVSLYHMLLEGVVFDAGQHTLLEDLADGALPGVYEGVRRVERDERWHIGFGLRCLIESRPSRDLVEDLLAQAEEAAAAWGDAVPPAVCERAARKCARRLSVAGLINARAASFT